MPYKVKRGTHGYWYNDEPITDVYEALGLLTRQSQTYEPNHLDKCHRGKEWEYEITVPWYSGGDSGGDRSGYDYFQIDPVIAKLLIEEKLVECRQEPQWGFTQIHDSEFVTSRVGKAKLEAFLKEMRAKSDSMLKLGVHTDLTGEPQCRGHFRNGYSGYGPLYFKYEMPDGHQCKVFPEENRVEVPEPTGEDA